MTTPLRAEKYPSKKEKDVGLMAFCLYGWGWLGWVVFCVCAPTDSLFIITTFL